MHTKTKITALLTAAFIATAPGIASANSISDSVFNWPIGLNETSTAKSTFDGKTTQLDTKTEEKSEAKSKAKRK